MTVTLELASPPLFKQPHHANARIFSSTDLTCISPLCTAGLQQHQGSNEIPSETAKRKRNYLLYKNTVLFRLAGAGDKIAKNDATDAKRNIPAGNL
ncbi:hypothetical protein TNCV_526211 [Trichonephila clavipes]|nr:hypothetical protein TNCV_526211 [Trichonephila clavipes]